MFLFGRFFNSSLPGFPAQLEPMEAMTPIKASASPGASCGPRWVEPSNPGEAGGRHRAPKRRQPDRWWRTNGAKRQRRGLWDPWMLFFGCLFVIQRATQKKVAESIPDKIYEVCVKLNSTSPLLRPNNINPEPSTFWSESTWAWWQTKPQSAAAQLLIAFGTDFSCCWTLCSFKKRQVSKFMASPQGESLHSLDPPPQQRGPALSPNFCNKMWAVERLVHNHSNDAGLLMNASF